MYILTINGYSSAFSVKKEYEEIQGEHFFAIGNEDKTCWLLCREITSDNNIRQDSNTGLLYIPGPIKAEQIRCSAICRAETQEELDHIILLYRTLKRQNQNNNTVYTG